MAEVYGERRGGGERGVEGNGRSGVGGSGGVSQGWAMINKVAMRDVSVLITGESGTGKEVVARNLHQYLPKEYTLLQS